MNHYLIAVGGTGAKVAESVLHLAAVGLMTGKSLHIIFVDQDRSNGNLGRTQVLLDTYSFCKKIGFSDSSDIFKAEVTKSSPPVWSPIPDMNASLKQVVGYNLIPSDKEAIRGLYDVLFSEAEKQTPLDEGFRGHPSIGAAAFFKAVNLGEEEPWMTLASKVRQDTSSGDAVKIFVAGSIFGGTGAAGVPTIARLLKDKLIKADVKEAHLSIGASLILPYFNFLEMQGQTPSSDQNQRTLVAKADNFLVKTKVALRYYEANQLLRVFRSLYVIGNDTPKAVGEYSIGSVSQRNDAHAIELLSALAAREFFMNDSKDGNVKLAARKSASAIEWEDFPDHRVMKQRLADYLRFAFVYLAQYEPIVQCVSSIKACKIPWLLDYFGGALPEESLRSLNKLGEYLRSYLTWIAEIHNTANQEVNLFNWKLFSEKSENRMQLLTDLRLEDLSQLVTGTDGYGLPGAMDIWHEVSAAHGRGLADFLMALYTASKMKARER